MDMADDTVRETIDRLLADRQPSATICPSEVARALSPHDWRRLMPRVRDVAFGLALEGTLEVRQRGRTVVPDGTLRGPIRLGRPSPRAAGRAEAADGTGPPESADPVG
jgi:hypothetical protein